MSQLAISNSQDSTIISPIDSLLTEALGSGVVNGSSALVVAAQIPTLSNMPSQVQHQARDVFRAVFSALVSVLNIQQPLATGVSGTVTLRKLNDVGGTSGSLTFVNGLITGFTAPT